MEKTGGRTNVVHLVLSVAKIDYMVVVSLRSFCSASSSR